jgi:hypothetical protein
MQCENLDFRHKPFTPPVQGGPDTSPAALHPFFKALQKDCAAGKAALNCDHIIKKRRFYVMGLRTWFEDKTEEKPRDIIVRPYKQDDRDGVVAALAYSLGQKNDFFVDVKNLVNALDAESNSDGENYLYTVIARGGIIVGLMHAEALGAVNLFKLYMAPTHLDTPPSTSKENSIIAPFKTLTAMMDSAAVISMAKNGKDSYNDFAVMIANTSYDFSDYVPKLQSWGVTILETIPSNTLWDTIDIFEALNVRDPKGLRKNTMPLVQRMG